MTCEVAVLNKYAIVLAADSAVTTTNGDGERRYSKGGNKIFQLSHHEPVGVMIFGSAAICGMPWEIVIKAYREEHLQQNKFDSVEEYADNFFSFIQSAVSPISAELRDAAHVNGLQQTALNLLREIEKRNAAVMDKAAPLPDRAAAAIAVLNDLEASIDSGPFESPELEAAAKKSAANPPDAFKDAVTEALENPALKGVFDGDTLIRVACKFFFRKYDSVLPTTGVVFAGYGKLQYFPCVIEYAVPGFVGDHFVCSKEQRTDVSLETPSEILPFATTSQVDAFMRGVGLDVFVEVNDSFAEFAGGLARSVLADAGAALPADLAARIEAARNEFRAKWYGNVLQSHYHSLKRVIGSLSLEEMAHLAETLVTLESLKERVTTPKQSVGGPIDVAVITKSEGLVWIKRKHFFDSEKNLRFILRQRALYQ
ncbi:hypothetical protein [Burkholderia sp. WSM2232]|uniref:hypothetical protein n=1 Tax=Burkholderia sp. WSM2232 TaxID=944436 RepID=UPI000404CCC1|nr:hypothetical protein [Burkholderia sp. WSM2232]